LSWRSELVQAGRGDGSTAAAVAGLVESLGGEIVGFGFLIELEFLKGPEKIHSYDIHSILKY
jgi:adenine phosphoribosyltransferase